MGPRRALLAKSVLLRTWILRSRAAIFSLSKTLSTRIDLDIPDLNLQSRGANSVKLVALLEQAGPKDYVTFQIDYLGFDSLMQIRRRLWS